MSNNRSARRTPSCRRCSTRCRRGRGPPSPGGRPWPPGIRKGDVAVVGVVVAAAAAASVAFVFFDDAFGVSSDSAAVNDDDVLL